MLFVEGKAVWVLEAKPAGYPLTSVELQADKYATGLPDVLNRRPLRRRPRLTPFSETVRTLDVRLHTHFCLDLGLQTGHARPDVGSLARIPPQTR